MTIMVRTKRADGCENDMACRNGELNKRAVHTGWPYQTALPADACTGAQYDVVHNFCGKPSSSYPLFGNDDRSDRRR